MGLIVWKPFRTTVLFLRSSRDVGPGEIGRRKLGLSAQTAGREFCCNGLELAS